jgi:hypothetical protein
MNRAARPRGDRSGTRRLLFPAITPAVVGTLADVLQAGVVLADADGMIALASTALEQMFG